MTLCKAYAPPPRGRLMAHAQRCGALPEPGQEWCAAHLRAFGWRRCPTHGWVKPESRTDYSAASYPLPTTTFWCPNILEGGGWCKPWPEAPR